MHARPRLEKCCCNAKPLLDDDCKYSMNYLKKADPDWYNAISGGTEWEILSSDMDTETPDAAHIISLALNNKNKVAFATGHLEILRTLKQLCTPDPVTLACPYDRVRTALLKRFGPEINDPCFYNAYQLVMTSGGINSESWNDFSNVRVFSSMNPGGGSDSKHILFSHHTRINIVTLLKCS